MASRVRRVRHVGRLSPKWRRRQLALGLRENAIYDEDLQRACRLSFWLSATGVLTSCRAVVISDLSGGFSH
jgi:hypothetical protein